MENKICIIGIYFGKLPNYFSLWLKSCAYNPTIDFLLFSDNILTELPENVKVYQVTLKKIKEKISHLVGFTVCLEKPYKICDYRPIYGQLFSDYLLQYDYWGHCDFDLIFGDLQYFFDYYNLYKYDRFNALGHLSLYRNTEEVNQRYKCTGSNYDYKTIFLTNKNCVFDEMPGMTAIYLKNSFPFFTKRIFADIASIYDRFRLIDKYKLDIQAVNYPFQIFYWENGKCFRAFYTNKILNKEEYLYIHFKKRKNFQIMFDDNSSKSFYITKYGFYEKKQEVTKEIIKKLNPYKGIIYESLEKIWFYFKIYFNILKNKLI